MSNLNDCANCRYWFEVPYEQQESTDMVKLGYCHRFPPIPFKSERGYSPKEVYMSGTVPITSEVQFCGEFRAR